MIPSEHHHEICYEELETDPLGVLQKAYEGMDLPGFQDLDRELRPEVEALKRYRKNEFDDDPYWMDRVYQELKPAFERFGYGPPNNTGDSTSAQAVSA